METIEKEPLSLRGKSMATSQFDSISRVSSNTAGLDYPTVISAIDEGQPMHEDGKKATVLKDDDLLEEFRYRQWQDLSPDPLSAFEPLTSGQHRFLRINVYKLFDFGTPAQAELLALKKAFLMTVRLRKPDATKGVSVRTYLEGNTKEEIIASLDSKPFWLNNTYYFVLSLLCLGWVIRLYLHRATLQVNYYLRKVVLN